MKKDKSITIKNIYYMLAYAYQSLHQENYSDIETESFDNILDLFASILGRGAAYQLKRGLYREYLALEEALPTVRGKIQIVESMRQVSRRTRQLTCQYDELSENCLMNQILKTAGLLLVKSPEVQKRNKDVLKRALMFFSSVDTLDPTTINWSRVHFHRNNATYRMLMNICYLILKRMLLTTEAGTKKLMTFLDDQDMSRLYEKFILAYYRRHYPRLHASPRHIAWDAEGMIDFLPQMITDIMLSVGDKKLIIDAKYYTHAMQTQLSGTMTIHSANLYQIFAYVKNEDKLHIGNVSGMLLYAKTDEMISPDQDYLLSGSKISAKTLDLETPFELLAGQLNKIAESWMNEDDGTGTHGADRVLNTSVSL